MTNDSRLSARQLATAAATATRLTFQAAPGGILAYLLIMAVGATIPVATAWLTKRVLDDVVGGAVVSNLLILAAGLVITGVIAGVLPRAGVYLQAELGRRVGVAAMDQLYGATERFTGLARFEDPQFLDRMRLAQAGSEVSREFVTGIFSIGSGVLTLIGFAGVLLAVSPTMAAVVLIAAAPALLVQLRLSRRRAATAWDLGSTERRELLYRQLLTSVDAAKEIRLFGTGPFFRRRMVAERRTADEARRRLDRREMLWEGCLGLTSALVAGGGLFWAVVAVHRGILSVGGIAMFVAAVAGVQGALTSMASGIGASHHTLVMVSHYVAVVSAGPDLPIPSRPRPLSPLAHAIEIENLWFRYSPEHPWALRGVDLVIPRGATVALVGLNGAGKTTLVKLLCRFYDPDRGAIRWDGVDLRGVAPADLRKRVSGVFQDHMNYDMTAAENIAISDLNYLGDLERITAAAKCADIHDTLSRLPRGYDTPLTRMFLSQADKEDPNTGVVLSGGQWQRVALARAILRDRRDLLILDEPSSGLDPEAEYQMHQRAREYRGDRTSLLISHRLNTVRDADVIVVLDKGTVVEQGSHDELIAANGPYARLYALQSTGYRDAVPVATHTQPHGDPPW